MANVCKCGERGEDETLVHRAEDGGWVVAKEGRKVKESDDEAVVRFHEGTEGEDKQAEGLAKGNTIVGASSIMIEPKMIRGCNFVGHIEDVVVDQHHRGKKLAQAVIAACVSVAQAEGCYKVILDCAEDTTGFYERCGFRVKEVQMRLDVPKA